MAKRGPKPRKSEKRGRRPGLSKPYLFRQSLRIYADLRGQSDNKCLTFAERLTNENPGQIEAIMRHIRRADLRTLEDQDFVCRSVMALLMIHHPLAPGHPKREVNLRTGWLLLYWLGWDVKGSGMEFVDEDRQWLEAWPELGPFRRIFK